MKIQDLEIGKHYLLDEPEGNDSQTEVYVESSRRSMFGITYNLHFVKDDETLPIFPEMYELMVFHEIKETV